MTTRDIVGSGKYTYEMHTDWAKVPEGWSMPAAAVYGDSRDRVYCFNRDPDHPVMIFDREGNYINSWALACSSSLTPSSSIHKTMSGWWNEMVAR